MKVIVQNLAVEYKDTGSGPMLVMLHGWGNTLNYFDTLCTELTDYRIVRLDLPGFGSSEIPKSPWTVEDYSRFVSAFCEKLKIEPRFMLGHSFGGRILTKGLSKGILRPSRIILVGSAGVAKRRTLRNAMYASVSKVGKCILKPFPKQFYERARRMLYEQTGSDYLTSGRLSQTFLNMIREDLSADAARITVPTLLVWGKNDLITPLSEGERLHKLISQSTFEVVENAGHFVYRDEPKKVATLIRNFLS